MNQIVYQCGTPVPRGHAVMIDHNRTDILLKNPKPFIKERIQEQFKVDFIDGNVVTIIHEFISIQHVVRQVGILAGADDALELNTIAVCKGFASISV